MSVQRRRYGPLGEQVVREILGGVPQETLFWITNPNGRKELAVFPSRHERAESPFTNEGIKIAIVRGDTMDWQGTCPYNRITSIDLAEPVLLGVVGREPFYVLNYCPPQKYLHRPPREDDRVVPAHSKLGIPSILSKDHELVAQSLRRLNGFYGGRFHDLMFGVSPPNCCPAPGNDIEVYVNSQTGVVAGFPYEGHRCGSGERTLTFGFYAGMDDTIHGVSGIEKISQSAVPVLFSTVRYFNDERRGDK